MDWTTGQNLRNFPLVLIPCRLKQSGGFVREWSQIADGEEIIPAIRKVNVDDENPMSINGYMTMSYNEEQFQAVKEFYAVSGRAQVISIDIEHFERAGWEALPDVKVGR